MEPRIKIAQTQESHPKNQDCSKLVYKRYGIGTLTIKSIISPPYIIIFYNILTSKRTSAQRDYFLFGCRKIKAKNNCVIFSAEYSRSRCYEKARFCRIPCFYFIFKQQTFPIVVQCHCHTGGTRIRKNFMDTYSLRSTHLAPMAVYIISFCKWG